MKKLTKLLALMLAVVMLLPVSALAAESEAESKELWMQWINWDEENYQPDSEVHPNTPQITPYDPTEAVMHAAFYTSDNDGEKLTPVPADKLEAGKGVTITPLCPGEKGKESYAAVSVAEWNKTYTISYNGYSIKLESRLPDLGLYTAPEATIENYIWNQCLGFSPLKENQSAYIISTCTDETRGRHMVDLAFAEDCADKGSFKLEKVGDNVYKVTLTGSVDVQHYEPRLTVTWQNAQFIGGNKYADPYDFGCWENASVLISEKGLPADSMDTVVLYDSVKDIMSGSLTLKAGETKTVYVSRMYFREDLNKWIVAAGAPLVYTASSGLKLEAVSGSGYPPRYTISCDTPGQYQIALTGFDWCAYDKAGKDVSEDLARQDIGPDYDFETGEWALYKYSEESSVPYEFDGRLEVKAHDGNTGWTPVTVTVEAAASEKLLFTDVDENAWYAPAVRFVSGKKYMIGNSETTFNPQGKIRGSEFAQLLYNIAGKPAAADGASFQGVNSQWYAPAILWAAGEGIVTDTGDTAVEPEKNVTREQIALMLYNYLGKPEGKADLSAFADAEQISAWAKDAMEWAVSAKVFQGSDGKLDPTGTATRAQVAQVLLNYFG